MSSIPRYLPVFTAGSTFPSVPADCPHFQWKNSWFVVWSRRCRVSSQLYMSSQYPAHLIRTPSLSVITIIIIDDSSSLLFGFGELIGVSWDSLLFPAFIPFFMASHRSSIQLYLVDLIFFLTSMQCWHCSLFRHKYVFQPLQFSSLVVYVQHLVHNQNVDYLRFIHGTSSLQLLPVALL